MERCRCGFGRESGLSRRQVVAEGFSANRELSANPRSIRVIGSLPGTMVMPAALVQRSNFSPVNYRTEGGPSADFVVVSVGYFTRRTTCRISLCSSTRLTSPGLIVRQQKAQRIRIFSLPR